jgi:hypothetical protein
MKLYYLAFFFISVIIVNWIGGKKATYWYLLLVLLGVLLKNVGRFNIRIDTPEILK